MGRDQVGLVLERPGFLLILCRRLKRLACSSWLLTSGIIRRSINEVSRDLALVTLSHIFNAIRLQCEPKRLYEFLFLTYAHSHESHISLHALLP